MSRTDPFRTVIDVSGECTAAFAAVKDAFAANFEQAGDVGASVAVAIDGELHVDLWGGFQDAAQTIPWERDTIVNVWSTSKSVTNLAALMLASRGLLDFDAPVATYWPEFASAGKRDVLVRHVLSHSAGLPAWQQPIRTVDLYNWELATSLLADQAPWWTPGSKSGYHLITQGYLVGELVRRIDGRSLGRFVAEEIAAPLGADFHIGLHEQHDHRVAPVIPGRPLDLTAFSREPHFSESISARANNPPLTPDESWTIPWRRAEIPAANGHGNARSVATIQSVISAGGSSRGGVEVLSDAVLEQIFEPQIAGRDLVLGTGVTFGLGFGLNSVRNPISPNHRVCYWGGWGGSLVVNDADARMTIAYVMNRMGEGTVGDDRAHSLLRAVYASLDV